MTTYTDIVTEVREQLAQTEAWCVSYDDYCPWCAVGGHGTEHRYTAALRLAESRLDTDMIDRGAGYEIADEITAADTLDVDDDMTARDRADHLSTVRAEIEAL